MILDRKARIALRSEVMAAPALPTPIDPHKPITDNFPELPRLVYRLMDVEGLTEQDVSEITSMRHAQVRKALERARSLLKAKLASAPMQ